jgi:hypothetical protein
MKRFIIETISSRRDINGNRYHLCIVTDTLNGDRSVKFESGGDRNGPIIMRRLVKDWGLIHEQQSELPIRQWNAYRKASGPWMLEHEAKIALDDMAHSLG